MRVVLDTNVLTPAFVFPGGTPEAVYRLAIEERVELVSSTTLLAELGSVLESKFGWEPARIEEAVGEVARLATLLEPSERVTEISADPADDRVLEAAMAGSAAAIVSGDRHLLALGTWCGAPIQRPAAFLRSLTGPA